MALDEALKLDADEVKNEPVEEKVEETTFAEDMHAAFEAYDAEEEAGVEDAVIDGEVVPTAEIEEAPVEEQAAEEEISVEETADTSSEEREIDCTSFCRTEEERASFAELPFEAQRVVEQRYKDFEADYHAKSEATADDRKYAEELRGVFQPFEAMIRAEGGSHVGAIENYLAQSYTLRTGTPQQKQQLLQQMAKAYDIELDAIEHGETYVDPEIQELRDQNAQFGAQLNAMQATATSTQDAAALTEVNAFKDAVDDKGQLLRPHFLTVSPQIKVLLETGQASSLEDAYGKALWLNDETAQQMRDGITQEAISKQGNNSEEKLAAAKKAGGVAPGQTSPEVKQQPSSELSMKEELSANWDKFMVQ
jgi:hypothetical protein